MVRSRFKSLKSLEPISYGGQIIRRELRDRHNHLCRCAIGGSWSLTNYLHHNKDCPRFVGCQTTVSQERHQRNTRSDVLSGIIECELPFHCLAPLEPEHQRHRLKASKSSNIPGGGWTLLNWKAQSIGVHTQRFQSAEQLRQPAAETKLEDLIYYLIDLGARPCAEGFRALKASGLWTPVGTELLEAKYPAKVPVLSVATSHDADGMISLALVWPDHPMSA